MKAKLYRRARGVGIDDKGILMKTRCKETDNIIKATLIDKLRWRRLTKEEYEKVSFGIKRGKRRVIRERSYISADGSLVLINTSDGELDHFILQHKDPRMHRLTTRRQSQSDLFRLSYVIERQQDKAENKIG